MSVLGKVGIRSLNQLGEMQWVFLLGFASWFRVLGFKVQGQGSRVEGFRV